MSAEDGSTLLAALKFFKPGYSRLGDCHLPRAHRAVRSWHKVAPTQQRLPFPEVALGAVLGVLLDGNQLLLSLTLLTQFRTYLRPGACDNLKVRQLIPPNTAAGAQFRFWGLLLNPTEVGPGPRRDRTSRRLAPARHGDLAARLLPAPHHQPRPGGASVACQRSPCCGGVRRSLQPARAARIAALSVRPPTRGRQRGPRVQAPGAANGEAARRLADRRVPQAIREGDPPPRRAAQDPPLRRHLRPPRAEQPRKVFPHAAADAAAALPREVCGDTRQRPAGCRTRRQSSS